MAITFVANSALGGSGNGGTNLPAWPTGTTDGDIVLLFIETAEQPLAASDITGSTFTEVQLGGSPINASTAVGAGAATATTLQCFWHKFTTGDTAPSISNTSQPSLDHKLTQLLTFRGVEIVGVPYDPGVRTAASGTAIASHIMPSSTSAPGRDGAMFVLGISWPTDSANADITWSQSGTAFNNLTERVDAGNVAGNGGGFSIATGEQATKAIAGATVTATKITTTTCAFMTIALKPLAISHAVAGVTGTLSAVASSIVVANKDGVAVAGVLGGVSAVASSINMKNKTGVSITAGLLGSVTGTAAVSVKDGAAIAGVLSPITGTIVESNRTGVAIAGVLASVMGTAAVSNRVGATIAGDLGSVTGDVVVLNKDGVAIAGVLGPIIGAVNVVLSQIVSVDGLLGAITGEVNLLDKDGVAIAGVLGAIEGAADIALGQGVSVAGVLGSILGAANVTLTNALTLDGLLGAITGNGVVDNRNHVLVAATLGAVTGHGAVTIGNTDCYDPMTDKRELILARLEVLLSGLGRAKRNDPDAPEGLRPAYMVLDGDEDTEALLWGHGRPSDQKHIIDMHPEVYYVTEGTDPALVGREMNEAAAGIIHAVLNDSTLLSYTLNGRGAVRSGLRSSVDPGRQVEGSLAVDFDFTYVFQPAELCSVLPLPVGPWLPDEPPRERILAAIARALAACPGVTTFKRNEIVTSEHALTAVMMLDGDEVSEPPPNNSRPANGPAIVDLQPEVYVIVAGDPAAVGPALNVMHQMLLRAVLTDALVTSLVHSKVVKYEGLQTGLSLGRSMAGEMGFKFVTQYMLTP